MVLPVISQELFGSINPTMAYEFYFVLPGTFPMHGINRSTCSFRIKHGLTQPFLNKGLFFGVLGSHGEIMYIYIHI